MPTSVPEKVDSLIKDHKVVLFSKSWCSYSSAAKRTLKGIMADSDLYIEELDQEDDGAEVQNYLQKKTGQRTVPNIFIGGRHIGGNSELSRIPKDQLKKLIAA